jgi:hypothetical protein
MCAVGSKPGVFVGSSTNGLLIARDVEWNLKDFAEPHLWQHVFQQNKGNLESLVAAAGTFDFAVLVLTPDDLVESKGQTQNTPRDNVLFELGIFMGRLGRDRTFAVYNRDVPIKFPSDLAGVTFSPYASYSSGNARAAVSIACNPIIEAIVRLGKAYVSVPSWHQDKAIFGLEINPDYLEDINTLNDRWDLRDIISDETIFIVVGGGLIQELLDRPLAGRVRDAIGREANGNKYRRGVSLTYDAWRKMGDRHRSPVISIGGQASNPLSAEIVRSRMTALGADSWPIGPGALVAFAPAAPPAGARIALFGDNSVETMTAVDRYIAHPEGLADFLAKHWGSHQQ